MHKDRIEAKGLYYPKVERPVTPGKEWGFSAWLPPGGTAQIEVSTDDGGAAR